MEHVTGSVGTVSLPPVITIVGFAVVFNVGFAILSHLIPSGAGPARPHEEPSYVTEYPPARLEQRSRVSRASDEPQPGLLTQAAASMVATGQDIMDLAREKRKARKEQKALEPVSLPHDDEPEPVERKAGLKRPLPASSASAQPANPSQAPLKHPADQ